MGFSPNSVRTLSSAGPQARPVTSKSLVTGVKHPGCRAWLTVCAHGDTATLKENWVGRGGCGMHVCTTSEPVKSEKHCVCTFLA